MRLRTIGSPAEATMVLYLIALLAAATIADSAAPQPNHGQPQLVSTTDGRVKRQMAEGGKAPIV